MTLSDVFPEDSKTFSQYPAPNAIMYTSPMRIGIKPPTSTSSNQASRYASALGDTSTSGKILYLEM
jgi:hypothetical protein